MRTAILSGIHANLQALEAVAADAKGQGVERFVCLGDTTGGGPNPIETARWVRDHCAWTLRGNTEEGLLDEFSMEGWSALILVDSVNWARREFEKCAEGRELIDWLHQTPKESREGSVWFRRYIGGVTGWPGLRPRSSFYDPDDRPGLLIRLSQHLFGWPAPTPKVMPPSTPSWEPHLYQHPSTKFEACLCGSGCYNGLAKPSSDPVYPSFEVEHEARLPPEIELKGGLVVSIGKLGMPRDGDPRAPYAIMDDGRISFRRVPYDTAAFTAALARTSLSPRLGKGGYRPGL